MSEDADDGLAALLARVPTGWTAVVWRGRRYGMRRTDAAGGGAVAVVAEELGGDGLVSTNVYRTRAGDLLRPCEMPAERVLAFLREWRPVGDGPAATGSERDG
ncbi:peptide-methionine (S)-S-oxide reductase [Friedmanniella endophytica]|uniref:Peptide-methionine (S)-S-oxide reductase n=1 Tax=Microlunatus kandeliicorticis TaxID=1759536 RepID=A0A7W3P4A3_9ACTN|nr:peptide methionine sulfoxide reductase [Microlunatus kandeliicorticis]MBA8792630.1 peptide-methionine (S)-S-oxide reductase [Microlunatus kandeliicorticis]